VGGGGGMEANLWEGKRSKRLALETQGLVKVLVRVAKNLGIKEKNKELQSRRWRRSLSDGTSCGSKHVVHGAEVDQ